MPRSSADWSEKLCVLGGTCPRFAHHWNLWETNNMKADPIIAEVWQIKDDLAREAGYDIHQLCENTRKWMAEHPHPGPIVHNAEELLKLGTEEARKRAEA